MMAVDWLLFGIRTLNVIEVWCLVGIVLIVIAIAWFYGLDWYRDLQHHRDLEIAISQEWHPTGMVRVIEPRAIFDFDADDAS